MAKKPYRVAQSKNGKPTKVLKKPHKKGPKAPWSADLPAFMSRGGNRW